MPINYLKPLFDVKPPSSVRKLTEVVICYYCAKFCPNFCIGRHLKNWTAKPDSFKTGLEDGMLAASINSPEHVYMIVDPSVSNRWVFFQRSLSPGKEWLACN